MRVCVTSTAPRGLRITLLLGVCHVVKAALFSAWMLWRLAAARAAAAAAVSTEPAASLLVLRVMSGFRPGAGSDARGLDAGRLMAAVLR